MTAIEFTELVSKHEKSICITKKKINGIYYTDLSLAEKIINELAIPSDAIVLDPCCGTGNFVFAALKKGVINVYGADIDEEAINLCVSNVTNGKFIKYNSIDNNNFTTLSKLSLSEKVDYVIGNPPFAKWSPSKSICSTFNKKVVSSGNNLFVAGLYRALELVKANGIVSYIIPKNFLHVSSYSKLRKKILNSKTIVSIIDIGAYFKNVRGEQVILTLRNSKSLGSKFTIKKLISNSFVEKIVIEQSFFQDEIVLFRSKTDFEIYNKLNTKTKLERVCTGHIGRGRSNATDAITGREIRKFGYKNTTTPSVGNQILIQNIYSSEAGIIAAFGGKLEAAQTVTVLVDGEEKMCRFILGILHSKVCNFFLYRYCFNSSLLTMHTDAKYLNKVPLPTITKELLDKIVHLVVLIEQETYMNKLWFSYLKELENIVYDAFELSENEVEYIESEMKFIQSKKWN